MEPNIIWKQYAYVSVMLKDNSYGGEKKIFKYLFIANLEDKSVITINLHGQKYEITHQPHIHLLSV